MAKEQKIYRIEEVRNKKKKADIGALVTYGLWLGSYIALPPLYSLPALAAYFTAMLTSSYQASRIPLTEEYKRFKEIYREIIKEYINLNENFDFKSPIDIYALFDLVYKHDIFSINVDKQYRMTKYDTEFMKELTLNSHGVCRHVATMLSDIYTQMGYQASPIVVATPSMKQEVKEVEIPEEIKKQMEELQKAIKIEIDGHIVTPEEMKIGEAKFFETRFIPQPITDKQTKLGNHAITRVNDSEYTYHFDPTKRAIYVPSEGDYYIDNSGENIRYSSKGTKRFNSKLGIETVDLLNTQSIEEQFHQICTTQNIIMKRQDEIIDFSKLIKPKLEEAEEMYKLILK